MIYEVYRQKPIGANVPQLDQPWELICETESDKTPDRFNWNSIVKPLTGESMAKQRAKGIWWMIIAKQ